MPQVLSGTLQGQGTCHALGIPASQIYEDELERGHDQHGGKEPVGPVPVVAGENLVEEDTGEQWCHQSHESRQQGENECQPEGCSCTFQILAYVGEDARLLTATLELRSRLKGEHHARI